MRIKSLGIQGLDIFIVSVETEITRGLFNFDIIGLGDRAIRESRTRILSSIKASRFPSPKTSQQKINVLLGPANIKKEGSHFDLPIALSYLEKTGLIKNGDEFVIFGELSLGGKIRPITDIQTFVLHSISCGFTKVIIPKENFSEVLYLLETDLIEIVSVDSLKEVVTILNDKNLYEKRVRDQSKTVLQKEARRTEKKEQENEQAVRNQDQTLSIDLITGQEEAKRALEISLAGKHHIVFYGPPGVGKSLIAKAAEELLPPISYEEITMRGAGTVFSKIEKRGAEEASLKKRETDPSNKNLGRQKSVLFFKAPFRNPHHTSSYSSIIGTPEKLGELSLAHNGILFLDEFAEFDRRTIEALRQPIEDGYVQVSRLGKSKTLPANVLVVATTNLCRCGNYQSETRRCTCTAHEVNQYIKKISGPISERVDLWVQLRENNFSQHSRSPHLSQSLKTNTPKNVAKTEGCGYLIKETIHLVRKIQEKRAAEFKQQNSQTGKDVSGNKNKKFNKTVLIKKEIEKLSQENLELLNEAVKKLSLSSRSINSIVSVARTIADINYVEVKNSKGIFFNLNRFGDLDEIKIEKEHILEALSYRKRF